MGLARAGLLVLVACSGSKPRTADDATRAAPRDTAPVDAAADAPAQAAEDTTGDLQVHVQWRDVPVPMRASPGRTPCGTPRPPAVAPTTTWGIPDVLVVIDGAPIKPSTSRIVLADCALAPRVAAATALVAESAADRPAKLAFARRGDAAAPAKLEPGTPRTILLPVAGHAVTLPLEAGGIYEVAAGDETAWIIASPNAGVTDASGSLVIRDLAPGRYAVTAWLPPRSGAPARLARGTVAVEAGDLATVTLALE